MHMTQRSIWIGVRVLKIIVPIAPIYNMCILRQGRAYLGYHYIVIIIVYSGVRMDLPMAIHTCIIKRSRQYNSMYK